ncbi:MAG: hypothetical protein JXN65_04500 [Clostridia bacterium]|nr:hypothetical protein [Clostridia bacterium]
MVARRIAVIDIGSNSVRMMVADVGGEGIKPLYRNLNTTRLYKDISQEYILSDESMIRTVGAIAEYVQIADENSADEIYMFATAAVRSAKNKADFVSLVKEKVKIVPEIVSEEKEAEMAFAGVGVNGACGVIDIGGASTEIAIGLDGLVQAAGSAKIGAVKCMELLKDDRDLNKIEELAESIIANELKEEISSARDRKDIRWYGVGGTITTMAAMLKNLEKYDSAIINQTEISYEELIRMINKLQEMDVEERKKIPGLQPKRADIIVYGLCILKIVMKTCGIAKITASDNDNLAGYINLLLKET